VSDFLKVRTHMQGVILRDMEFSSAGLEYIEGDTIMHQTWNLFLLIGTILCRNISGKEAMHCAARDA
jgi:hypothetical protein